MIDIKTYMQDFIEEFDEFITYRVAGKMDMKEENLREKIFIAIEEYNSCKKSIDSRDFDKIPEAINNLLIYYQFKIYITAFIDGFSLPFLKETIECRD